MSATALQALIFDVDGTLADTESAHRASFNHAFAEMGLGWEWDEALYTELLNISGGKERILHYWKTTQPELRELGAMAMQDTVHRLHELKTAAYESAVNDGAVSLRPGVLKLKAAQCLAFEDSSNGLRSATAAGLATLITPTRYTAQHDFSAAMRVVSDLSQVNLAQLRRWHAQSQCATSIA